MCPGCGGGKEVHSSILIQAEERYGLFFLMCVCSEERVGHKANKPISELPKKKCRLLTIDGNPIDEGEFMFE